MSDEVATAASLALLLEVSATPKSGNVDRDHNFSDLKYEHFLASSVAAYRVFRSASGKERGVGKYIYEAVKISKSWHKGGNAHFGAFLLLIPLVMASNTDKEIKEIGRDATRIVKDSTVEDSLYLARAFNLVVPRVMDTDELSLTSKDTVKRIEKEKITLYEWMRKAPETNLIARELTGEYPLSVKGAEFLLQNSSPESIIHLYHRMLAEYPDPLIISKFGEKTATQVMKMAERALEKENFEYLDNYLISRCINPGTIADLTASSIFLAILGGYRI